MINGHAHSCPLLPNLFNGIRFLVPHVAVMGSNSGWVSCGVVISCSYHCRLLYERSWLPVGVTYYARHNLSSFYSVNDLKECITITFPLHQSPINRRIPHVICMEGVCYPRVQSSVVTKLRVNLLYLLQLSNSQFTYLQNGAKGPQSLQDFIDLHLRHTIVSQEKSILFQRQISFHRN